MFLKLQYCVLHTSSSCINKLDHFKKEQQFWNKYALKHCLTRNTRSCSTRFASAFSSSSPALTTLRFCDVIKTSTALTHSNVNKRSDSFLIARLVSSANKNSRITGAKACCWKYKTIILTIKLNFVWRDHVNYLKLSSSVYFLVELAQ